MNTAEARKQDLELFYDALGSVTAFETVTLRSRVDGELIKVNFIEGQLVKKGELLALVDPRPYEVQLTQAEGQLIRDKALLANAAQAKEIPGVRAIFGEKAGDVKDTSLRVPPGIEGVVIDARVFSRKGVEKDDRSRSIEDEAVAKLQKDQADKIAIIRSMTHGEAAHERRVRGVGKVHRTGCVFSFSIAGLRRAVRGVVPRGESAAETSQPGAGRPAAAG